MVKKEEGDNLRVKITYTNDIPGTYDIGMTITDSEHTPWNYNGESEALIPAPGGKVRREKLSRSGSVTLNATIPSGMASGKTTILVIIWMPGGDELASATSNVLEIGAEIEIIILELSLS